MLRATRCFAKNASILRQIQAKDVQAAAQ